MAWSEGYHVLPAKRCRNTTEKLKELTGELTTQQAQAAFAQFCAGNPAFTTKLLMGIDLYPFQDVMIRAMMQKDSFLGICSRGLGKSTIAGVFIPLYAIFNPGVQIGITSASFRQARSIFEKMESIIDSAKGKFLKQCLKPDGVKHKSDAWEMSFSNGSKVVALPLGSGDKIRGYRFNLLIIDELLLLSEKVINEVLLPFMAIQLDPRGREKVREAEASLIAAGKMDPDDATVFTNNKLIGLTSASYQFEYLYKMYCDYKDAIFDQDSKNKSSAIMQLSCEIAPKGLYDESNIEMAKRTFSAAQYAREYMASFTGDSSGFYSARKLYEITFKKGEGVPLKIRGDDTKIYVLAIDPNYDSSESSDHFAMCLLELEPEYKSATMVHGYAVAAGTTAERLAYIRYLFDNFNIQYVIADRAGGTRLIKDINEADALPFKLGVFENEILEFTDEEVDEARANYEPALKSSTRNIVHLQNFDTKWIRIANEALQGAIENKFIWFGHDIDSENMSSDGIPIKNLTFADGASYNGTKADLQLKFTEFCDRQNEVIQLTKEECAMIEVTTTQGGAMRFDLPSNLRSQTGPTKTRKDSYTVLVLANWAKECYYAITSEPKKRRGTFKPRWLAK